MTRRAFRVVVIVLALVALGGSAAAHERSASHSTIVVDGHEAHVELRVTERDLGRLAEVLAAGRGVGTADPESLDAAALEASTGLRISTHGGTCRPGPGPPRALAAAPGFRAWELRLDCPEPASPLGIESRLFAAVLPHHLHFVRVVSPSGVTEDMLTAAHPHTTVDLAVGRHGFPGLFRWVRLGVEHILGGADHLAFLLALLVGATSLGGLVRVVTGFTIGHSATLALAALGHVHPDARLVESVIGLSIVVVAVENGWAATEYRGRGLPVALVVALALGAALELRRGGPAALALGGVALAVGCHLALVSRVARPERLRAAIAATFGLVHGLGFAGALSEHPIPAGDLVRALLGFNAGVELGQLAVATLAWTLLARLAAAHPEARRAVLVAGSSAALSAGIFWAVTRLA